MFVQGIKNGDISVLLLLSRGLDVTLVGHRLLEGGQLTYSCLFFR